MKCKCKKSLQEIKIKPIVQISKRHYRRSNMRPVNACAPRWTFSFISTNWLTLPWA